MVKACHCNVETVSNHALPLLALNPPPHCESHGESSNQTQHHMYRVNGMS